MLVMKFGGTSLDGAGNILDAVELVLDTRGKGEKTVVVVSAMGKTTNTLREAARLAARGRMDESLSVLEEPAEGHREAARAMGPHGPEIDRVIGRIDGLFEELRGILRSVDVLGEMTPRALDRILGTGERLSAPLVSLAFQARGVDSVPIDASEGLIVTDRTFGEAAPDRDATRQGVRTVLGPLTARGILPVVTGFVGSTAMGEQTTLGPSGSDYSAALIGAALDADEVWIWSDVDGILTADPKIVPHARVLGNLSYVTAAELASCGAEVLHPKTIRPLAAGKVPLRLKNTFNPSHAGTLISSRSSAHFPAIISTEALSLVSIKWEGDGWMPEITTGVLERLARAGVKVLLFVQSSWQQGIGLVIRRSDSEAAMMAAAADSLAVRIMPEVATVSVIGPGLFLPAMAAFNETEVELLALLQAAAGAGIVLVVPECDMPRLVNLLHDRLNAGIPQESRTADAGAGTTEKACGGRIR